MHLYEGVSFIIIEEQRPIIIMELFLAIIPQHCLLKEGAVKKSYGHLRERYTASRASHDK